MDPADAIWQAIVASNRAWLEGRPREVEALFDERAVTSLPSGQRVEGRTAIVQGYVDYVAQVKTFEFEETDRAIDVFGSTAIATYRFRVRYELDGKLHDEHGRETLVFVEGPLGWRAVWRPQGSE
jgi:ketosteroid isomerase-like protein